MRWPLGQKSREETPLAADIEIEEIIPSPSQPGPSVQLTPRAEKELSALIESPGQFLRIWVEPGGCSGMTYVAGIDDERKGSDHVVYDAPPLRVIVDPRTLQHVHGLEIDYSEDLVASGFRFRNPNAVKACGCGASFGV